MKRYCLEIYEPDSTLDVLHVVESDHPFLPISVGDSIHPGTLPSGRIVGPYVLRVTGVQHILLDGDVAKHKVCVFTALGSRNAINDPDAEFSRKDRWLFAQTLRLLELQSPAEARELAQHREALEEGYELHYSWLFEHLWGGLTSHECREVLDVLDMYRAIAYAVKRHGVELDTMWFPFPGFDGNAETAQMAYTRYFVNRLGRYGELEEQGVDPSFNSHLPTLPKYRNMLHVWREEFNKSHDLSSDQVQALLAA